VGRRFWREYCEDTVLRRGLVAARLQLSLNPDWAGPCDDRAINVPPHMAQEELSQLRLGATRDAYVPAY
jgi:hypothetical protein